MRTTLQDNFFYNWYYEQQQQKESNVLWNENVL